MFYLSIQVGRWGSSFTPSQKRSKIYIHHIFAWREPADFIILPRVVITPLRNNTDLSRWRGIHKDYTSCYPSMYPLLQGQLSCMYIATMYECKLLRSVVPNLNVGCWHQLDTTSWITLDPSITSHSMQDVNQILVLRWCSTYHVHTECIMFCCKKCSVPFLI